MLFRYEPTAAMFTGLRRHSAACLAAPVTLLDQGASAPLASRPQTLHGAVLASMCRRLPGAQINGSSLGSSGALGAPVKTRVRQTPVVVHRRPGAYPSPMGLTVESITEAVLSLPSDARALLADRLVESLDPLTDESIRDAWCRASDQPGQNGLANKGDFHSSGGLI